MRRDTKEFFAKEEIDISSVKAYLGGLKVNPLEEEDIINKCKNANGKIGRKKFILWGIDYFEKQKPGTGRAFLEMAGFRSISDL